MFNKKDKGPGLKEHMKGRSKSDSSLDHDSQTQENNIEAMKHIQLPDPDTFIEDFNTLVRAIAENIVQTDVGASVDKRMERFDRRFKQLEKNVLNNIESGEFAKEWEGKWSRIKFKFLKFFRSKISFAKLEKKARKNLYLPEFDQFAEVPYPKEDEIKKSEQIQEEINSFKDFYQNM